MLRDLLLQNATEDDEVDFDNNEDVPKNRANKWQKAMHERQRGDDDDADFDLFSAITSKSFVSKMQQREIWDLFVRKLHPDKRAFKTHRKLKESCLPTVMQDIILRDRATGEVKVFSSKSFPRKKYKRKYYDVLAIMFHTKINQLAQFHLSLHSGDAADVIGKAVAERSLGVTMGIDGVPHSVSSTKKMTCMTIKFDQCDSTYNYGILIRAKDFDVEPPTLLNRLVADFTHEGCRCKIRLLIMDMPMRAFVLCMKQFNAHYGKNVASHVDDHFKIILLVTFAGCDQCLAKGKSREDGRGLCYPSCYMNCINRTKQSYEELGELATRDIDDNVNDVFGHKGKCTLLSIPYFDPEVMVPVEPMHLLSNVITKLIDMCLLNNKEKSSHWRTVVMHEVNKELRTLELPSEFQRTMRDIDLAKNKTQELKNYLIFGFDIICKVLEKYDAKDEAEIFSNVAWLIRVLMMPDGWYHRMRKEIDLKYQSKLMYRKFEAVFSADNCTANFHNLFSHLVDWRNRGELRDFSAEPFESAYGKNKKRFRPGTDSEGSQIMTNGYIANETGHFCFHTMRVAPYNSNNKVDNSIFADSSMRIYQCVEIINDREILAKHITVGRYKPTYLKARYSWPMAGVFVSKKFAGYKTRIETKNIAAKGVVIGKNLIALATRDMMSV